MVSSVITAKHKYYYIGLHLLLIRCVSQSGVPLLSSAPSSTRLLVSRTDSDSAVVDVTTGQQTWSQGEIVVVYMSDTLGYVFVYVRTVSLHVCIYYPML